MREDRRSPGRFATSDALHRAGIQLYRLCHDKEELKCACTLMEHCAYWRRKLELEVGEISGYISGEFQVPPDLSGNHLQQSP